MENDQYILVEDLCQFHSIQITFLEDLREHRLIEFEEIDSKPTLPINQISKVERMIRLHRELDINAPGIDAVFNLLDKVESYKSRITELKNKLRRFEE